MLRESLKEAFSVIVGNTAGLAIAALSLAGILVGTLIDPVAGAIASAAFFVGLVAMFVFALRQRSLFTGPYRVLAETVTWEFKDPHGREAKLTKEQKVRFNYLAITHIELATGDGDLFADFSCNYGSVVRDTSISNADENGVLAIDGEKGVLVLLKPQRARNEEFTLKSTRTVRDGFMEPHQWVFHQAAVPSKKTALNLIFPTNHQVKNVRIKGPTGYGDRPAKKSELVDEGSRQVLRLKPRAYRAGQSIKVLWEW